ncbi:TM2 domain-containing protein [Pontibacter harenae]|uniref:TM2 domain-containing protein n=1 Tax=Pontibacter harenae TaxID=2894083 RepID=UPI001E59DDBF|nr:TM2 domain-containing protein [Pontibacter harenae]MCC9165274.1 TM2 domain-containing protein [Pontibacter harenae]
MKKQFSLLALMAVILFSACSKEPNYFSHTPVVLHKKQKAEATATTKEEAVITVEALPTTEATATTDEETTVTASVVAIPAVVKPKLSTSEATTAVAAENAITKKEVKHAIREAKKELKEATKQDAGGGGTGKSQLVALILAALIGALGIHRFYLGYTTIGIIQILTLGGCGIWALIDLIRIITGDLKPANGDYSEKL